MKMIFRMLLSALAVVLLAKLLPGVSVDTYVTALIVAVVLSILNLLVKPILIILTLPVTLITFGLFLLVINALIILLADYLIAGFDVSSFWWALLFSLLLSLLQSIFYSLLKEDRKKKKTV
ncbi:MAG: phage holin family protein [Flavobacteriaceae bacterium]|nr:phage holin family protein [Flavobacteriaceae bacterium]